MCPNDITGNRVQEWTITRFPEKLDLSHRGLDLTHGLRHQVQDPSEWVVVKTLVVVGTTLLFVDWRVGTDRL